jgi:hypothetical protein
MKRIGRVFVALAGSLCAALVACGGSGGGSSTPPPATTYVLTVDSAMPASGVAIGVSPADVNGSTAGTTSFTRTYDSGATVTLTAPATSGTNTFASWSGCTSVSGTTCTVSMTGNVTVTANYAIPVTYTLIVNSTNPASGVQVTVSPADNNSNTSGTTSTTSPLTFTYNSGASITVSVPGTNGAHGFTAFSGATCTATSGGTGAASTCTLTLSANTTLTANYGYNINVDSTNPGSGVGITVSPSPLVPLSQLLTTPATIAAVATGSVYTFVAPATASGSNFTSWTGCTSVTGTTCNLTVAADATVTADYTPAYTLTVNSTDPASGVAIGASPNDLNGSGAGTTAFTRSYASGAMVTLTAPATVGSGSAATNFSNWTGCTSATGTTCNVTMSANTTVTANYTSTPTYTLTVVATGVPAAVAMTISPADVNGNSSGNTIVTRTYSSGTAVTVTAPATTGSGNSQAAFGSWTGCTTTSSATCDVTISANTTVTAAYAPILVSISPNPATATIGSTLQFSAVVTDPATTSQAVTWSVSAPAGSTLSPGDISASGLYTTPFPAPPTITVKATSVGDPTASASVTVTLGTPATAAGPALSVDAGNQTHAISPLIYGMNNYQLEPATTAAAGITVDRFGGDATTRYNYLLDVTSSAADYYFENQVGATGVEATSQFNQQVASDAAAGAKTLGTVNVMGYVAKDGTSCSFPVATYPNQYAVDTVRECGDGETAAQADIASPPPTNTSIAVGASFAGNWVSYLVGKFGSAANGGVAMYDLDNEPEYWVDVHRDVHPLPATYDEMTNGGIATAEAVKTADPTAEVSGPIVSGWFDYFYSAKDVASGYSTGPCYQPWQNPVDREAHNGTPFIQYYLQQMSAASTTFGARLLDYLDIHAYYAADYPSGTQNSTGLTTAGDTGAQMARLNSTRVFWDPTYTDPNEPQPNYITDANYTSSCSVPLQAPQLIPMLKNWVSSYYPGTKTSIDEYNWGGQENINGAVAQADILGIFGREGLDMGVLWGPPNPTTQVPGLVAFEVYRNYDGAGAKFGDMALASTSGNQGQLAVYGAQRTSDGAVTIVVLNKTYGSLTSTLSLPNLTATGPAQVYLYSAANLAGLAAQPAITVTAPANGSTTSSLSTTFPGQSITLLVIPTK